MSFLSDDAFELARRIRRKVGPDKNHGGAASQKEIMELWDGKDPGTLVPAIEGLESYGLLRVDRGVGINGSHALLKDIFGLSINNAFQDHMDEELGADVS